MFHGNQASMGEQRVPRFAIAFGLCIGRVLLSAIWKRLAAPESPQHEAGVQSARAWSRSDLAVQPARNDPAYFGEHDILLLAVRT